MWSIFSVIIWFKTAYSDCILAFDSSLCIYSKWLCDKLSCYCATAFRRLVKDLRGVLILFSGLIFSRRWGELHTIRFNRSRWRVLLQQKYFQMTLSHLCKNLPVVVCIVLCFLNSRLLAHIYLYSQTFLSTRISRNLHKVCHVFVPDVKFSTIFWFKIL